MGYKETVYRSDNCIEYGYCFKGKYGAKGEKRAPRKKATPEQIKRQNQLNKEALLRRTIQANFYPNDLWTCLKYLVGTRKSYDEVKKDFDKFLRGMRKDYKIRGEQFKYIYRIEIGARGGIHIHILFNRVWGADLLASKNWVNDRLHFTTLREEGGYSKLASYIAKPLAEEPEQLSMFIDMEIKLMSKYGSSRNLIRPEPEVKEPKRKTVKKLIQEGPTATKGFYIDKNSVRTGINEYTGYSYLYYTELRLNPIQRVVKPPNWRRDLMEVNIYIETDAHGPARRKKAKGIYLIECLINDKPYTVHEVLELENTTENQMSLTLLAAALKRMTKSSTIRVFMPCEHVLNTLNGSWNIQWQKNGWKNAAGKHVKNAVLWQEVTELLSGHIYTACNEKHSYGTWMNVELRKNN